MRKYKLFLLLGFFAVGLTSCFDKETYPDEPAITFDSFRSDSTIGYLRIGFTDGDGDLGLNSTGEDMQAPFDSGSYYHFNMYVQYYEKTDLYGWQPGKDLLGDSIVFKYRMKRIEKTSSSGLKGTLEVEMNPSYYNPLSPDSDTIKYRIQLIDRNLNKSEWIESDVITR